MIFIPKKINVGFQNRSDTYTKMLAYVIYYDENNKLRKEASWNSWRDHKIPNLEFENNPTSGFVLNKKAGGYSSGWNHRQTYVRVYDPRGFEFEIGVDNLLYILENSNSFKGKGLDGDFVYAWSGKDLVLVPCESPDYVELQKLNTIIQDKTHIVAKELTICGTYKHREGKEYVYMGRYDYHAIVYNRTDRTETIKTTKKYWFWCNGHWVQLVSLGNNFVSCINEKCVENYAELFDRMECSRYYSPYDPSKDEFVEWTLDEFGTYQNSYRGNSFKSKINLKVYFDYEKISDYIKGRSNIKLQDYRVQEYYKHNNGYFYSNDDNIKYFNTIEEIFEYYKPLYINRYLKNGKFFERRNH